MSKKTKVEMLKDYKFAELPQNGGQIIDAKEGEVHSVSLECAEEICASKAAKRVADEVVSEEDKIVEEDAKKVEDEDKDKDESLKDKISNLNPFQKDKKEAEKS